MATPLRYSTRSSSRHPCLCYNYAHKCIELLHNYYYDWHCDSADALLVGMLVNSMVEIDGFLKGDLDGEHLNKKVNGKTNKPNVTPTPWQSSSQHLGIFSMLQSDYLQILM